MRGKDSWEATAIAVDAASFPDRAAPTLDEELPLADAEAELSPKADAGSYLRAVLDKSEDVENDVSAERTFPLPSAPDDCESPDKISITVTNRATSGDSFADEGDSIDDTNSCVVVGLAPPEYLRKEGGLDDETDDDDAVEEPETVPSEDQ